MDESGRLRLADGTGEGA